MRRQWPRSSISFSPRQPLSFSQPTPEMHRRTMQTPLNLTRLKRPLRPHLLPNFAVGRRHRRCWDRQDRTGLRLRPRALLDEVRRFIQRAEWFDSHSGKPFDEFAEYIGFAQRPGRCEAAPEGPAGPLQDALPVDVVPPPIGTVELVAVAFDGKPLVAAAFDHHVNAIRSRLNLRHHSIA